MKNKVLNNLIYVTGGAKSGKTKFAEEFGRNIDGKRYYLATAGCRDLEMGKKISNHKKSRADHWVTIEEEFNIKNVILSIVNNCDILLIDCITLWISNLIFKGYEDKCILDATNDVISVLKNVEFKIVIVSNELGMGIVPENALARRFRDIHGKVNQLIAEVAGTVYFMVSGIGGRIK